MFFDNFVFMMLYCIILFWTYTWWCGGMLSFLYMTCKQLQYFDPLFSILLWSELYCQILWSIDLYVNAKYFDLYVNAKYFDLLNRLMLLICFVLKNIMIWCKMIMLWYFLDIFCDNGHVLIHLYDVNKIYDFFLWKIKG